MEHELVRVDGLPGDVLSIENGLLTVNSITYPESYLTHRPNYTLAQTTVPEGEYFVLGDNRSNSNDSHVIGTLTRKQVVGHVQAVIFPFSGMRVIE